MIAQDLPSGIVTFVFTDIEGSTRLLRRLGDAYPPTLERHNELLRRAWSANGGVEINTEGDAFFVAFQHAADAAAACVEGQELLAGEAWPEGAPFRVRMGVHAGLAEPRGRDYVALAVHQAARVAAAAHGGQVVLTPDVAERLAPGQIELRDLGRYRLRDFDQPVTLFQAGAEDHPALRALPAEHHNLVPPASSFVGSSNTAS
jgi:class 3 adenylate cyclase